MEVGLKPVAYTAHSSVATIHNALVFNHSAIPLPKFGLRLPYRIADVIETNAMSYMDFFRNRI